jgi:tRNA-dihydrouridine synthase B
MQIGNLNINGILFLAPLAGISNRSFRILARKYGADFCYTEMISSDAIVHNQKKTMAMIDLGENEHPVGVQLFGSSAENIGKAVAKLDSFRADLIDLNLGCPVKKVIKRNGGAGLLRDLTLTNEILMAAVENTKSPITIKMRTGWEADSDVFLEAGKMAEKAGVAAITLHPRSRSAGFSGKSDWSKIGTLKKEVAIPVIGNGDINSPQDAADMLNQTGCDAIMIGRAAIRNPYVFEQIKGFLNEKKILPEMAIQDKIKMALEHSRLIIVQFGEKSGSMKMRKHLGWYTKGFIGGARLREKLKTVSCYDDINRLFDDYLSSPRTDFDE